MRSVKAVVAAIVSLCFVQIIEAHTSLGVFVQNGQASDDCVRPRNPNYYTYPLQSIGWFHGLHDQNLTCGYMPEAGRSAKSVCNVRAGETVGAGWANPPEPDSYPIIIEEHKGIYQVYMTQYNHGSGGLPQGNVWFKIQEGSLSSKGDYAVPYALYENNGYGTMDGRNVQYGTQWFQIPSDIPDGDYLIRPEVLTFQECTSSTDSTCAQHYIGCIQVRVTGGGNGRPTDLASFPGTYNEQTKGLHFVLWGNSASNYVSQSGYPGPSLYVPGNAPAPTPVTPTPTPPPAPVPVPVPVPDDAGIIEFAWYTNGQTSGSCVQIYETLDTHSWRNNYLCAVNEDISSWVWSSFNPVEGDYNCVQWNEAADWSSWGDNFLCIPTSDTRNYAFSCAGEIPGMTCISVNEPRDPDTWVDNYWCTSTRSQGMPVNVGANGFYNVSNGDGASQVFLESSSSVLQVSFALVALILAFF